MCVRARCVATESLQLSHVCTILYLVCVAVAIFVFFLGGLVLFAGFAAGLLAGVFTQFIQCGEYRSAVKVSTCNNLPPNLLHCRQHISCAAAAATVCHTLSGAVWS
mgnify:CR=1 FL=1